MTTLGLSQISVNTPEIMETDNHGLSDKDCKDMIEDYTYKDRNKEEYQGQDMIEMNDENKDQSDDDDGILKLDSFTFVSPNAKKTSMINPKINSNVNQELLQNAKKIDNSDSMNATKKRQFERNENDVSMPVEFGRKWMSETEFVCVIAWNDVMGMGARVCGLVLYKSTHGLTCWSVGWHCETKLQKCEFFFFFECAFLRTQKTN